MKKNKVKSRVKKRQRYRIKKGILIILGVIFFLIFIYSLLEIIKWHCDNKEIEEQTKEIEEKIEVEEIVDTEDTQIINPPEDKFDPYWDYIQIPLMNVDFDELIKTNSDTVGFISVDNTNINYPVVQYKNNEYYLNHSFEKKYNDAGWIFMDYRNNALEFDKNTIIYGHSRYDKSLFGSLRNITKKSWYNNKDNHIIRLSTKSANTLWQVFSVYTIKAESYYLTTNFNTDNEYKEFINTIKKRSIYNFNTDINTKDKILTLSSCYTSDGIRVVLHAKLIKRSTLVLS